MNDSAVLLSGETRFWSLLGWKGLILTSRPCVLVRSGAQNSWPQYNRDIQTMNEVKDSLWKWGCLRIRISNTDCKSSRWKIQAELSTFIDWEFKLFNSHEWPRHNFSLQYQYNINQISDENTEKYQFGDN